MILIFAVIAIVAVVALFAILFLRAMRNRTELERQSITAEALHDLLTTEPELLIFDVRLPLDFLTDAEMIPGATRISPKEIQENPTLIPRDRDTIVYCTCPSDETSMMISRKARALNFLRVRFLKGGLEAWKGRGYPVEPFKESFHLDTAT